MAKLNGKEKLVIMVIISEARERTKARYGDNINASSLMDSLLELPAEAREVCLHWLQRNDIDDGVKLTSFFHDLNGLAKHDRFFLPRIKELQEFAED